jgi:hypothetical protein
MPSSRSPADTAKADWFLDEIFTAAKIPLQPSVPAVFHYTSADGLRGILQTGEIFASHIEFLNDTTELQYGLGVVRPRLAVLEAHGLKRWVGMLESGLDERLGTEIFATCFCAQDDLLPQWHGYGAAGSGYSIGFGTKTLSLDGKAILLPVSYGDAEAIQRADLAIQWAIGRMKAYELADDADAAKDIFTTLATCLILIVTTSKKAVFGHEQEWRFFTIYHHAKDLKDLEFRTIHGLLVPYLRVTIPRPIAGGPLDIVSIRCGPTLLDDAVVRAIRLLLSKSGLPHVPVLRSEAPLRR